MRHEDKTQFATLMGALAEYYSREISGAVIGMYWQGLEHYELAAVREALNRHMQNAETGQFFPKIADIAKMLTGTSSDCALQAWAKVDKAVRQVGPYETVVFDDALIHRVLHDMGGWISLSQKTEDEWPFVAREFENRYRGFKSRNEVPEYPPKLIGIAEAHNAKEGFTPPHPVLIGNKEKARAVQFCGTEKPMISFHRPADLTGGARLTLVQKDEGTAA